MWGPPKLYVSSDPVAGAELVFTVSEGILLRVLSVEFVFVTSAVVATRQVTLRCRQQASEVFRVWPLGTQLATTTRTYSAFPGIQPVTLAAPALDIIPLPQDMVLTDLGELSTVTAALDVGDNYGPMALYVQEWVLG